MEEYRKCRQWIARRLSSKRLHHVLSVVAEAEKLAKKNEVDVQKVKIAALLHDAAKEIPLQKMQELCHEQKFPDLSEADFEKGEILHGFAATALVQKELGIQDKEILEAIAYHTIGKKDLSLVAKIVYIADAIEETRDYPGVKEIRETTHQNLEKGILLELQHKEKYLTSIGATLHSNTIEWKESLEEENYERRIHTRNI